MMFQRRPSSDPLWRDEFSVETAKERYVTRRQFSKFLVLTSFGMLAGNLWILIRSLRYRPSVYPAIPVARLGEIPVGGVKQFRYPAVEDTCLMVRTGPDRYVAYSQKCTHLSCAVYYSKQNARIECPCHVGYFSAETGEVLQGPPPRPLPRVILQRRGEDLVAIGMKTQKEA